MVGLLAGLAIAALPAAALLAQPASAPFTVAETGRAYSSLQDALDAIGSGSGSVVVAPGTYRECAVQEAGRTAIRASVPGQTVFDGVTCEGKAALVLRGESTFVEGIVFTDMAVEDGNGAGIRMERGNVTVSQSWFRDSQQGILTAGDPDGRLTIDKSTFSGLGTCEYSGGCAHSIYAGELGEVVVTRTRFERGTGGHYLKSRAQSTVVRDSSFDDSSGQATNYMVDLPNGGTGAVENNRFVQGRDKENYSAFVAVGAEGASYSSDGLRIVGNDARFVPGLRRSSAFVADWTGDRLVIEGNTLGSGLTRLERR
ncbi:hypothetical protein MTsN3n11_03060 [Qipengyuania sp. MTN3-11]